MSRDAQRFFEEWVAHTLVASAPWTDYYPTPMAAWTELRSAAHLAGLSDEELRAALGDPVEALTAAMLDAPAPDAARFAIAESGEVRTAAAAMELALSYADGLADAVRGDRSLSATLVLNYLARQGFALRTLSAAPPHDGPAMARAAGHLGPAYGDEREP